MAWTSSRLSSWLDTSNGGTAANGVCRAHGIEPKTVQGRSRLSSVETNRNFAGHRPCSGTGLRFCRVSTAAWLNLLGQVCGRTLRPLCGTEMKDRAVFGVQRGVATIALQASTRMDQLRRLSPETTANAPDDDPVHFSNGHQVTVACLATLLVDQGANSRLADYIIRLMIFSVCFSLRPSCRWANGPPSLRIGSRSPRVGLPSIRMNSPV